MWRYADERPIWYNAPAHHGFLNAKKRTNVAGQVNTLLWLVNTNWSLIGCQVAGLNMGQKLRGLGIRTIRVQVSYCHAAARTSHVMFRLLASMLLECLWWRVWCRLVSRWSALLTWPLSTGTGLREPRRNQERIKRVYHFRLLSTMLLSRLSLHSRVSSRGLSSSAVIFKQIKHTETDQKITVEGVMDQSSQVNTHIWLDETDEYWSLIGGYLQQQKKIGSWEYCGGAGQNQCHPFCKSPIVNQVMYTEYYWSRIGPHNHYSSLIDPHN